MKTPWVETAPETTEALVLSRFSYVNRQRVVRLFTRSHGMMTMITGEANRMMVSQVMQPLEITFYPVLSGRMPRLKTASPVGGVVAFGGDAERMNVALLWGEMLWTILREEECNIPLYDYIRSASLYLAETPSPLNFNLYFLYHLCDYIGYRIDTEGYCRGHCLSLTEGRFSPSGGVGPNASEGVYRLCSQSVEMVEQLPLAPESQVALLRLWCNYLSYHLNVSFNARLLSVFEALLS